MSFYPVSFCPVSFYLVSFCPVSFYPVSFCPMSFCLEPEGLFTHQNVYIAFAPFWLDLLLFCLFAYLFNCIIWGGSKGQNTFLYSDIVFILTLAGPQPEWRSEAAREPGACRV